MQPQPRRVVTAFLMRGNRILLGRRSPRVATYRGAWAAISGTTRLPEDFHVYLEIYEETGLRAGEVVLLQKGRPVQITDRALGRRWIITPYLFRVRSGRPRLNWEHERFHWVHPAGVGRLSTVPHLAKGLARVYPPLGGFPARLRLASLREIERIALDRKHGAAELARRAHAVMHRARSLPTRDRSLIASTLAAARPLMPGIGAAAQRPLRGHESRRTRPGATPRLTAGARRLLSHLAASRTLLTHSYSSSVINLLAALHGRDRIIFATDSEPPGEGRRTRRALRALGYQVRRVRDREAASFLHSADLLLVGADAITRGGDIVNKRGTRSLAARAAALGKPVLCAADPSKRLPQRLDEPALRRLLPALDPEGYFEVCPARWITGFLKHPPDLNLPAPPRPRQRRKR